MKIMLCKFVGIFTVISFHFLPVQVGAEPQDYSNAGVVKALRESQNEQQAAEIITKR